MRFYTTIGVQKQEIPIEVPSTTRMNKVLSEIAKKLNAEFSSLTLAPMGGIALVSSEYQLTVGDVVEKYGDRFSIINKGVVG